MPECGCQPAPESDDVPAISKRSRKTKGLRLWPRSDGLIRRVMGPCRAPKVRRTIRRGRAVIARADSVMGSLLRRGLRRPWLAGLWSQGLQRPPPRDEVIEHRVDGRLLLGTGPERGEVLEIGEER